MSRLVAWMDRTLYPGFAKNWDDALLRHRIEARLRPDMNVLDLGAGAGIVEHMNFRGRVARICGADLDPRVTSNPYLDEGRVASAEALPWADATFDLVFSDNVLEHLGDPAAAFREVRRVLKPGGTFVAKTPNRNHYVATLARITPTDFHRWINRRRGRAEEDTFPTRYRANTSRRIRALATETDLELRSLEFFEGRPEYLRLTAITYTLGWLYERAVNSAACLAPFRVVMVAEFRRPERA